MKALGGSIMKNIGWMLVTLIVLCIIELIEGALIFEKRQEQNLVQKGKENYANTKSGKFM